MNQSSADLGIVKESQFLRLGITQLVRDQRREQQVLGRDRTAQFLCVVDRDQKQASADVSPFAKIARKSDFSAEKLAFFLLDPHPKMPNFPLN
jgi:hypothetical protein